MGGGRRQFGRRLVLGWENEIERREHVDGAAVAPSSTPSSSAEVRRVVLVGGGGATSEL